MARNAAHFVQFVVRPWKPQHARGNKQSTRRTHRRHSKRGKKVRQDVIRVRCRPLHSSTCRETEYVRKPPSTNLLGWTYFMPKRHHRQEPQRREGIINSAELACERKDQDRVDEPCDGKDGRIDRLRFGT